ncbi:MAG: site-2 protease family protein [Methanobacteriaceae archaeon]
MNALWYYGIAFLLIWIIALLFKNKLSKLGFEIKFPIIMWKTKRFIGFIDKLANISPKFWKWFMNVGIIVSVGGMILMAYLLISSLPTAIETPSVSLIVPGVEIPGSPIFIPLAYGIFALATVIIVHEFGHGILSRVEKVNIKSMGLLLAAILPGAFVEPDEEELKKSKRAARLRIYAAGSVSNLTLSLIAITLVFLVSSFAIPAAFYGDGIVIDRTVEGSPASTALYEGLVIHSINGMVVKDINGYSEVVNTLKPNQKINVSTDKGIYSFTTSKNPNNESKGYMGIQASKHYVLNEKTSSIWGNQLPYVLFIILEALQWIYLLNIAVGLFNLLPMKPLDGGHILENILGAKFPKIGYINKKVVSILVRFISIFILVVIGMNFILSFL